ncbi:MAG: response regulator transcription factor [Thermomicrobiales bacterium]
MNYLACLFSDQHPDDRSEGYHQESLRIFREIGDAVGMAQAAGNLGELALEEGRSDVAVDRLRGALLSQREIGDAAGAARVLTYVGHALVARGDLADAAEALAESLTTLRDAAFVQILPDALRGIAALVAARGEHAAAARFFGAEHALRTTLGVLLPPIQRTRHDAGVAAVRGLLGEAAFSVAWDSGRALSLDEAIAFAMTAAAQEVLTDRPQTLPDAAARYGLTRREVEVLALLVAGQSDPQIGETLSISARTVESHVSAILAKLGQPSRTAAVAHAVRHDLV